LEAIFGDFFGSMLGLGSFDEPPDTVPLSILGLPELPTDESELRRAFVRKVRELHPDLNPLDEASWAGVHGDEWEAVQWARSVLTRKLQDAAPVTGESGRLVTTPSVTVARNAAMSSDGERVTRPTTVATTPTRRIA